MRFTAIVLLLACGCAGSIEDQVRRAASRYRRVEQPIDRGGAAAALSDEEEEMIRDIAEDRGAASPALEQLTCERDDIEVRATELDEDTRAAFGIDQRGAARLEGAQLFVATCPGEPWRAIAVRCDDGCEAFRDSLQAVGPEVMSPTETSPTETSGHDLPDVYRGRRTAP